MPVPFAGQEFVFLQPDKTEIKVIGWGNQFTAVFETPEGYTVVQDPVDGYYHYAKLSEDRSTLLPTPERVNQVQPSKLGLPKHLRAEPSARRETAAQSQAALGGVPRWQVRRNQQRDRESRGRAGGGGESVPEALPGGPVVGNRVGLCLLVAFPDVAPTIAADEIGRFCNLHGYSNYGNNGSVFDYFSDVSGGKLHYTNVVTPYYVAQHPEAYYTDPQIPFGQRARELIVETLTSLKAGGFDFSQLSSDADGYIYALNVLYAGPIRNNWSQGLWPHSWVLASPFVATPTKKFADYQITNIGTSLTLGTFCHENGHMVCSLPDLYDYGYESYGAGNFCLMAYGASDVNPCQPCGYLKLALGWDAKRTILTPGMTVQVSAAVNDLLKYPNATVANEYFVIENREKTGRDAAIPDGGLAIWHCDEHGSNNNEAMTQASHYECALEQADGQCHIEHKTNAGDANDLFGAPDKTIFGAATTPNSNWWNGTPSGLEIESISAPGPVMSLHLKGVAEEMASIVGDWPIVAVDWGNTGHTVKAGPFTFNADGTWKYPYGGGRWIQVGSTVAWNFTNAPGLIYTATVTADAIEGVMGYASAPPNPGTGSFYGLRAPTPASPKEYAAALMALIGAESEAGGDSAVEPLVEAQTAEAKHERELVHAGKR